MRKDLPFLLLLFVVSGTLCAQKPSKWGDIPASDYKLTVYTPDSAADAVVLQDIGHLEFEPTGSGFELIFSQHRRIKVFDQSAFKEGNLFIPYYSDGRVNTIKDLDVEVFSPDGVKTKVKTDNIFTEQLTENVAAKKVFVPNLQKGSIIEYKIRIETGDWLTTREWFFQDSDLPTRWSELTFEAPDYFNYLTLTKGARPWDVNEQSAQGKYHAGADAGYKIKTVRLGLADLPALKREPFVTTVNDYRTSVQFQLKDLTPPGQEVIPVLSSWKELGKTLLEDSNLGMQYERGNSSDKTWAAFKSAAGTLEGQPKQEIIAKALRFVSASIVWDGSFSIFSHDDIDDAFAKKSGNLADINLALIAILRRADIQVVPMLVSTRSNGIPHPEFPLVDQFNALVAFLPDSTGSDTGLLLDASSPFLPAGLAQEEIYNNLGWVMQKGNLRWVNITAPESVEFYKADLTLDEAGTLRGHVKLQLTGQLARQFREKLSKTPLNVCIKNRLTDKFPDVAIDSVQIENADNPALALKIDFTMQVANAAQVADPFIYYIPINDFIYEENPFKTLKRSYPVNFPYPIRGQFTLSLKTPPGYKVEELPPSLNLVLPNDGGKMIYTSLLQPSGAVQINLRMNLKQLDFQPEEYDSIRMFFDKLIGKMEEQIVFKKP